MEVNTNPDLATDAEEHHAAKVVRSAMEVGDQIAPDKEMTDAEVLAGVKRTTAIHAIRETIEPAEIKMKAQIKSRQLGNQPSPGLDSGFL